MKRISFTWKERKALIEAVEGLQQMFEDCDTEYNQTEKMLNDGLGSAMRKLTRGTNIEGRYKEYKFEKES